MAGSAFDLALTGPSGSGERLAVRLEEAAGGGASEPATILYLHGFGAHQEGEKASFFRRRAAEWSIPFCSFDFRGHGRSGGAMADLTLSRNLADVSRVEEELRCRGYRRVVLLGSSMGALTALWHAALAGERIAAALLIAPALGMEEGLADWTGPDGMARWRRRGRMRVENELGSWELGWGFVEDLARYDERLLMSRLTVPCLVLQGMRDDRVDWRRVVESFSSAAASRCEVHLFCDGDHRLVDRKERLWVLMTGFLAELGLAPPI